MFCKSELWGSQWSLMCHCVFIHLEWGRTWWMLWPVPGDGTNRVRADKSPWRVHPDPWHDTHTLLLIHTLVQPTFCLKWCHNIYMSVPKWRHHGLMDSSYGGHRGHDGSICHLSVRVPRVLQRRWWIGLRETVGGYWFQPLTLP